jgi:hypothetical protein
MDTVQNQIGTVSILFAVKETSIEVHRYIEVPDSSAVNISSLHIMQPAATWYSEERKNQRSDEVILLDSYPARFMCRRIFSGKLVRNATIKLA